MPHMSPRRWLRRSMLFVPGNNPAMIETSPCLGADSVILDLEDAVVSTEKDAARFLVRASLRGVRFGGMERVVRVNGVASAFFREDVEAALEGGADTILLPKADREGLDELARVLDSVEGPGGRTGIIGLIETARGLKDTYRCSEALRLQALFLGAEDLALDMGMERTGDGSEILYARSRISAACAAAGLMAIDTPFVDVGDEDGLRVDAQNARRLGFTGKGCIHPLQVEVVHEAFAPSVSSVDWARRVLAADAEARSRSQGVVALDGRMIDAPIVARARNTLERAGVTGPVRDEGAGGR